MRAIRVPDLRSAAARRPLRWARLLSGVVVGLAAVLFAFCPQAAHAGPVIFESRTPSMAWVVDGAVGGAQRIAVPQGPFRIYGTLKPGEAVDAFEFVVPSATTATAVLHVKDAAETKETRLTLTIASADGKPLVEGTPQSKVGNRFDWRSLERLRVESSAIVDLAAGQTYILAVAPGTVTDVTVPYSVVVTTGGATGDPLRINYQTISDIGRLWLGSYAQQSLRGPRLAAVILVALILLVLGSNVISALISRIRRGTQSRAGELGSRSAGGLYPEPAFAAPRTPYAGSSQRYSDSTKPMWVAPPAPVITRDTGAATRPSFAAAAWPQAARTAPPAPPARQEWRPEREPQPAAESLGVQATSVTEHASELSKVLDAETMRSWELDAAQSPAAESVHVVEPESDVPIDLEWELGARQGPSADQDAQPAGDIASESPEAAHMATPGEPETVSEATETVAAAPGSKQDSATAPPIGDSEPVPEPELGLEPLWDWEPEPLVVVEQDSGTGAELEAGLQPDTEAETSMVSELEALIAAVAAKTASPAEIEPIPAGEDTAEAALEPARPDSDQDVEPLVVVLPEPESEPPEWALLEGVGLQVPTPLEEEAAESAASLEPAPNNEAESAAPSAVVEQTAEPVAGPEPTLVAEAAVQPGEAAATEIPASADGGPLPEPAGPRESEPQAHTWFTLWHRRRRISPAGAQEPEDRTETTTPEELVAAPGPEAELVSELAAAPGPEAELVRERELEPEPLITEESPPESWIEAALEIEPSGEPELALEAEPPVEQQPYLEAESATELDTGAPAAEITYAAEAAPEPASRSKRGRRRKRAPESAREVASDVGIELESDREAAEMPSVPPTECVEEPVVEARYGDADDCVPVTLQTRDAETERLETTPHDELGPETNRETPAEAEPEPANEPETLSAAPAGEPTSGRGRKRKRARDTACDEVQMLEPALAVPVASGSTTEPEPELETTPEAEPVSSADALEELSADVEPTTADVVVPHAGFEECAIAEDTDAPAPQGEPAHEDVQILEVESDAAERPLIERHEVGQAARVRWHEEPLASSDPADTVLETFVHAESVAGRQQAVPTGSAPPAAALEAAESTEPREHVRAGAKAARRRRASAIPKRTARDVFGQLVDEARYRLNIGSDADDADTSFSYGKRIAPYAGAFEQPTDEVSAESAE